MKHTSRKVSGFTLIEVQVSALIGIMVLGMVAGSIHLVNSLWGKADAENNAKEMLYRVESRMAPTFREALRVVPSFSNSEMAMVVLPKLDSEGDPVIPLEDGDFYHFYFSDEFGSWDTEGPILWRAVNGIPDQDWSMRGQRGVIDLGEFIVEFQYLPLNDPDFVRLAIETRMKSGSKEVTKHLYTDFHLRNHKFK